MATRLKECRCGRKIPVEWPPDCPDCVREYTLAELSGENEMRRADRRLTALHNRGLEPSGLDLNDPVVAKVMEAVRLQDLRTAYLLKRQVHREIAAESAMERFHWEPKEAEDL